MPFKIPVPGRVFALACLLFTSTIMAGEHWHSAAQMSEAANALIASLNETQRKSATFPLDDAGRTTWSNLPVAMVRPGGLLITDMNGDQRIALHDLLRASTSSQGYAKLSGIVRLEDHAKEDAALQLAQRPDTDTATRAIVTSFDSDHYAVAVFGEPGSKHWGWKIAGHHAAANFTVSNGRVGFTPTFLGSNPRIVQSGKRAGWSALPHEGSRGLELLFSLDAEQRKAATVDDTKPGDVIEGPGRRGSLDKFEGLKAGSMNPEQQRLLRALVSEYVRNADFDAAEAQLALIEADFGELRFSWRGPHSHEDRFYYRVHGPRILIEYARQDENHDHTVVRDPKNDYGEDWLGRHYEEHHPSMEEAMENARRAAGG